jgi:hypothetical protein
MNQKTLNVSSIPELSNYPSIHELESELNSIKDNLIDIAPWPEFSYKPTVRFKIAYNTNGIVLQFSVAENELKVNYQQSNEAVYKDSCVEFFFSVGDEPGYYNFEFNAIGTCLAAYGINRNNRNYLSTEVIKQIQTYTNIKAYTGPVRKINWELTVFLPVSVFLFHKLTDFNGLKGTGNFYKCGDDLNEPHYLVWSPILTDKPDFHLRKYFGNLNFI